MRRIWRRFRRRKLAVASAGFLVLVVVAAIAAPLLARYEPNKGSLRDTLQGPSWDHWLGTDKLGRDILTRLLYGARVAVLMSAEAVGVALIIGVPIGLALGYFGGRVDKIGMRLVETIISIPGLVVAITIISVLGPGIARAMFAVGIVFGTVLIRLVRGEVMATKEQTFVDAARINGARPRRVMWRHVLPVVAPVVVVQVTLMFAQSILAEAGLSFLGLGVTAPNPSWGVMLSDAQEALGQSWALVLAPGLAIVLTVLAFNQVGDAVRDALGRERHGSALGFRAVRRAGAVPPSPGGAAPAGTHVLDIDGLTVRFPAPDGTATIVVGDLSLQVDRGEIVALVGESGSGKSLSALATLGLVPEPGDATARSLRVAGIETVGLDDRALRRLRGTAAGIVFQEPMSCLDPTKTVGRQLTERMTVHGGLSAAAARRKAIDLLEQVGIPDPVTRLGDYPHQFSGGMAQRVMIAQALACDPQLLIADEPTTALDVTVQAQVLALLRRLRDERGLGVLLITHDLGVVADVADRVAVMYAGQIVETGQVDEIFAAPLHPYTELLLRSVPRNEPRRGPLVSIRGVVPAPWDWPVGCHFADRCPLAEPACRGDVVPVATPSLGRNVRCVHPGELGARDLEVVA